MLDFVTEYLKDVKPVIEENHMYIRIASNDFFAISKDVVSKMISGEYNAVQAYQSFNTQLLEESPISENIVLEPQKTYSNVQPSKQLTDAGKPISRTSVST